VAACDPINVAVFCSGRGSNLQAILNNIGSGKLHARVVLVISSTETAGALDIARSYTIPGHFLSAKQFPDASACTSHLLEILQQHHTDLVVLAGYLKMIPEAVVDRYEHRIINIHPALLPSFGGKGLYGHFVHEAVLQYGCKVSGATVHLVDKAYDTGAPLLQKCVPVLDDDTPDTLAARVLTVEHEILSQAIQLFADGRVQVHGRKAVILPIDQKNQNITGQPPSMSPR
jgi:phosphoribosylglycinamide formyltransferase 1